MKDNNFNKVCIPIDRNKIQKFVFTPSYIKRCEETIPVIYDITFIPTIDYFFGFNFKTCNELIFSN